MFQQFSKLVCYGHNYTSFGLYCFCSITMSDFLQAHGLQHTRLPCPSQSPRFCSNSCPLSWQCISSSASSRFAFNLSQHQSLCQGVGSWHQVAKILELQRPSFQ